MAERRTWSLIDFSQRSSACYICEHQRTMPVPGKCLCAYKYGACTVRHLLGHQILLHASLKTRCLHGACAALYLYRAAPGCAVPCEPSIKCGTYTCTGCVCYVPFICYCVALIVISGHVHPRPTCLCVSCPFFVLLMAPRSL